MREFPLATGKVDYLLFMDGKAVGVVEAKPEGTTLSGVAELERRLSVPRQVDGSVEEPLVRASRLRQTVLKSAFDGRF